MDNEPLLLSLRINLSFVIRSRTDDECDYRVTFTVRKRHMLAKLSLARVMECKDQDLRESKFLLLHLLLASIDKRGRRCVIHGDDFEALALCLRANALASPRLVEYLQSMENFLVLCNDLSGCSMT